MKIAIISDIHANYEALKEIKPYLKSADIFICLGDIIGYYPQVNEVIDFLRQNRVICISGNHDEYLIDNKNTENFNDSVAFGIKYARENINNDNLCWLKTLKSNYELSYENKKLFFCHANPWNNYEYLYKDSLLLDKLNETEHDLIAFGHTHRFYFDNKNKILINPGSIGQSRDNPGYVEFVIFDTKSEEIIKYDIKYDFNKTMRMFQQRQSTV